MTEHEMTTRVLSHAGGVLAIADFLKVEECRRRAVATDQVRLLNLSSSAVALESVRLKWTYADMDCDVTVPRFTVIEPGGEISFLTHETYGEITDAVYDREPLSEGLYTSEKKMWTLNLITTLGATAISFETRLKGRSTAGGGFRQEFLFDLSPGESA